MRRDAERLGHKLGLAMADACDGMLALFRDQNPKEAITPPSVFSRKAGGIADA